MNAYRELKKAIVAPSGKPTQAWQMLIDFQDMTFPLFAVVNPYSARTALRTYELMRDNGTPEAWTAATRGVARDIADGFFWWSIAMVVCDAAVSTVLGLSIVGAPAVPYWNILVAVSTAAGQIIAELFTAWGYGRAVSATNIGLALLPLGTAVTRFVSPETAPAVERASAAVAPTVEGRLREIDASTGAVPSSTVGGAAVAVSDFDRLIGAAAGAAGKTAIDNGEDAGPPMQRAIRAAIEQLTLAARAGTLVDDIAEIFGRPGGKEGAMAAVRSIREAAAKGGPPSPLGGRASTPAEAAAAREAAKERARRGGTDALRVASGELASAAALWAPALGPIRPITDIVGVRDFVLSHGASAAVGGGVPGTGGGSAGSGSGMGLGTILLVVVGGALLLGRKKGKKE